MFNRFTERARKVIILAKEEARRFNHDYIGTEHILLGLIREGEGWRRRSWKRWGWISQTIRLEVEKVVQPGQAPRFSVTYPLPRAKKGFGVSGLKKPDLWDITISAPNTYC